MMERKKRYLPSATFTLSLITLMLAAKVIYDQKAVQDLQVVVDAQNTTLDILQEKVQVTGETLAHLQSVVYDLQNLKHQTANLTAREKECLHRNIYYEAGVEPFVGKIAVAQVTLNRLQSRRWGNNLCNVVYSDSQFSWTLDSSKRNRNAQGKNWEASRVAMEAFLRGFRAENLQDSLHYHATWMPQKPQWAKRKTTVAQISQHVFYRN